MADNKLSDEQPKKFFEIHQGDVGTTAFEDRYVHWLESQLAAVTAERDGLMSATLGLLASRDITWDNGRSGGHDWQHAVEQAIAATQQEASDDE